MKEIDYYSKKKLYKVKSFDDITEFRTEVISLMESMELSSVVIHGHKSDREPLNYFIKKLPAGIVKSDIRKFIESNDYFLVRSFYK